MTNWFKTINGAVTLSLMALLSEAWRGFLDAMFVFPTDIADDKLMILGSLIFTLLFSGWAWALAVAAKGSRGGLAAEQFAVVPATEPGTYYILLRGFATPESGTDVNVLAEFVPLALIMMAVAELNGLSPTVLHIAGVLLVVARVLHPMGLSADSISSPLRTAGAGGTLLASLILMVSLAYQLVTSM